MKTTLEELSKGFKIKEGYASFKFGNNQEYELCFEFLIFENQMYVALYKNGELLTNKIVVKPGYLSPEEKLLSGEEIFSKLFIESLGNASTAIK